MSTIEDMGELENGIRDTQWFKLNCRWKSWKETIGTILDQCDNINQAKVVISLIKTGSRCGEISSLLKRNVFINRDKNSIVCSAMLVEKKKTREMLRDINNKPILIDGERQFSIIPKKEYREFAFPLTEKYNDFFLGFVNEIKDPNKPVFPFNRWQCYYLLSTIGAYEKGLVHKKDWWMPQYRSPYFPHLFRHYRATQLCSEYSNFRNPIVLKDWFLWSDTKMSDYYIKLSLSDQYVDPKEVKA